MNVTIEMAFNIVMGLFVSGVWYWVKSVASNQKETDRECISLRREINTIQLTYQSRDDAKEINRDLMVALKNIESEIKELNRQVSQKEDKK